MARPKQLKATFYLPLVDNDGRSLSAEIARVEEECFIAFGAWTWVGEFRGAWRMATGDRHLDTCAVYAVVLDTMALPQLEVILLNFKARTTQEAIYLEVEHDVDVRFL